MLDKTNNTISCSATQPMYNIYDTHKNMVHNYLFKYKI